MHELSHFHGGPTHSALYLWDYGDGTLSLERVLFAGRHDATERTRFDRSEARALAFALGKALGLFVAEQPEAADVTPKPTAQVVGYSKVDDDTINSAFRP